VGEKKNIYISSRTIKIVFLRIIVKLSIKYNDWLVSIFIFLVIDLFQLNKNSDKKIDNQMTFLLMKKNNKMCDELLI
jgi:hypothetical protein